RAAARHLPQQRRSKPPPRTVSSPANSSPPPESASPDTTVHFPSLPFRTRRISLSPPPSVDSLPRAEALRPRPEAFPLASIKFASFLQLGRASSPNLPPPHH